MSYKFFNTNTQKTSFIDLPNCEIKTDSLKYVVKNGIIKVFNLVNGKIEKGDEGTEIQQIQLSDSQMSIFQSVKSRDEYTDRLDCDDLQDLDNTFKDILRGTYGDRKETKLKKVKTSDDMLRYTAKNKKTKEIESLEVKLEKDKKKSDFSRTWLGRIFSGASKPKVIEYKSYDATHKVEKGDSLTTIAKNYDIEYDDLVRNNPQLWEIGDLKAGQKIKIPNGDKKFKHVVSEGETIDSIAKQYNIKTLELLSANENLKISVNEPEINSKVKIPPAKHKTTVKENNVVVTPKIMYTTQADNELPSTIANDHDISLYRLALANLQYVKTDKDGNIVFNEDGSITFKKLPQGTQLAIPEHKTVAKLPELTIKAIAEEVGVSEAYIRDILFGIEGRHSKPDLKAYDDGVAPPNSDGSKMTQKQKETRKSKGWSIGTPTIGFGHTGRVHGVHMGRNTSEWKDVEITEKEAYLILANDIYAAVQDARAYIGEDFDKAPQSIQDALTDIVFNKGVAGFQRKKSPCLNLKEDLANRDYVSAAADMIVDPTVVGLMRRNTYRVLVATRDLSENDRQEVLAKAESYKNKTINTLKKNNYITLSKEVERDWNKAKTNNIAHGFFMN